MSGHRRVRDVDYDSDEIYTDEEEEYNTQANGASSDGYTAEDKENFASLTPVVRAELEEAGLQASDREIQDALWHYYWEVGKSVTYLKNTKLPKQPQQQQGMKKEKAKSKFDQAAEKSAQKAEGAVKAPKQDTNGLAKQTQGLSLGSASTVPSQPSQPKAKSKGLDVPKIWGEQKSQRKPSTAFVVIGHVDHGKSTLMGRLLLDSGAVQQRDIDKFRKQATEMGKASFALAWVMDTGSEERERGVTVEVAQHHFSTEKVDFTILDAPGHRDFVPNMIGGASMADLAVLVIDANQLESGLKGQTREHIQLARAVGLKKVIVAVNKMDTTNPPWNEDVFRSVSEQVMRLLREVGFTQDEVHFVPCSGLNGENVVKAPSTSSAAAWISKGSKTLISALEGATRETVSEETLRKPLRLQAADVFRGGIQNPLSVSGRITTGSVQVGDTIVILPGGDQANVKGIEVSGAARDWAVASSIPVLHLDGDLETLNRNLRAGDIICAANQPGKVSTSFTAKILAIDTLLLQAVDVHLGRLHVPGNIKQLVASLDAKGELVKKKPRVIKAGQSARVKLTLQNGVPLDVGMRLVLRGNGSTVAAGMVEAVDA